MKMETRSIKVMTIKGKPVMDGVAPKKLTILPEDIGRAKTHSASACAAAIAIRRQFKLQGARVYLNRTYMEQESIWVRYITPAALRDEIISFDRDYKGWKGGEFTLRPPPPSQQQGTYHQHRKEREAKSPPTKRKSKLHTVEGVRNPARGSL